ncbi:exopolygalacturonase-like [Malus sylvestris]|uniref:exopolygalacturonase-like n=1 Tax=Malus sylvestris TaxID=3752 RepID=UPI0021ABFCBB|nr:exopolygalacturonase-like [Malus sylvestris]
MAIAGGMYCHVILILCLAALASRAAASVAIPPAVFDVFRGSNLGVHDTADPDEKIFNVVDFGAKPDGNHDASMNFIKTWIAACKNNTDRRSRVLIPPGTYKSGPAVFQGPCTCAKPIVVQVLGTIKGLNDLSLYEEPYWFLFEKVEGLVITGNGIFDGQGSSAWKVAGDCGSSSDGCSPLPSSIKFNSVSNGVIRGISSLNSKGVHLFITDSQNVRVRRVNISAPGTSPNTDGIHISNSNNVKVARTHIATGDDCIGMIQGSTNIAINNVICGPGHGISVGSLGKYEHENDVKGITVKKTTFLNTDNGIRIKSWPGSGPSLASGMVFKDLIMQNVRNPIIIDQEYCAGGCDKNQPSRVQISNVHYINIKGTTPSNVAVDFICSSQVPCQNIQLHDIDLKYTGPNAAALTSVCKNVKAGFGGIQNPPACH